jgi:hypothetical protein
MVADTFRQGTQHADYLQHERVSRPERGEQDSSLPFNPAVAWSISLLTSLALWWGIWLAVSSLASVLV